MEQRLAKPPSNHLAQKYCGFFTSNTITQAFSQTHTNKPSNKPSIIPSDVNTGSFCKTGFRLSNTGLKPVFGLTGQFLVLLDFTEILISSPVKSCNYIISLCIKRQSTGQQPRQPNARQAARPEIEFLCSHRLCETSSEFLRSCNVGLRTASNEPCWRRNGPVQF